MRTIHQSALPDGNGRRAFSVIDLLLAIVFFATMLVLVIVGIQVARMASARSACQDNLRQIGGAYHRFVAAKKGDSKKFVGDSKWIERLAKDVFQGSDSVFICPSDDANATKPAAQRILPNAKIQLREGFGDFPVPAIPLSENGARCRLSTGKIPVTPPSFALEIESAFSDRQWKWDELIMRVDPRPDGSITITAVKDRSSPYAYDLIGPEGELLVQGFRSTGNATYTFPPSAHKQHSYGVNSMARYFSPEEDRNKLLAVDYKKRVCNVVTNKSVYPAKFRTDFWPSDCAPRHGGALNVLFVDGHVKSMKPADLDPRVIKLRNLYWLPTAYQYVDPLLGG